MPKKLSIKDRARHFKRVCDNELAFVKKHSTGFTAGEQSAVNELALIRVYREFERLMLESLVSAINQNTDVLSTTTGTRFPRHMTAEVCQYLVIGTGFFDFKGRDGLIKKLKSYLPVTHFLVVAVAKGRYTQSLDRLVALRNFAVHSSKQAKQRALGVCAAERMSSAGSWLRVQARLEALLTRMKELAEEIRLAAPY